ncbi:UNVERIFIED_ORG: hypothetical protein FHR35_000559 [Microbispora rosea subsp. rosea]
MRPAAINIGASPTTPVIECEEARPSSSCTELGLAELLEALDGRPLEDRPAEAARTLATRYKALRPAEESALYENTEWYRAWLNAVSRDGTSPARWWRIFGGDTARATVVR